VCPRIRKCRLAEGSVEQIVEQIVEQSVEQIHDADVEPCWLDRW
jgi:hypothetical protein